MQPARGAAQSCSGYDYAGLVAGRTGAGIEATVKLLATPRVAWGHVAGWIGVGGPGDGPGGSDEWLQVGFSGFSGGQSNLYYEVKLPGSPASYNQVLTSIQTGEAHEVAVREVAGQPGTWQVVVDGKPAGHAVRLPGSHNKWHPMAMTESWANGRAACNGFRYGFTGLSILGSASGAWQPFGTGNVLETPACRILNRRRNAFVGASA